MSYFTSLLFEVRIQKVLASQGSKCLQIRFPTFPDLLFRYFIFELLLQFGITGVVVEVLVKKVGSSQSLEY
jgi:hypothetical protein